MVDAPVSAFPAATTPLAGTEPVPLVQGGVAKRTTVGELRKNAIADVNGLSLALDGKSDDGHTHVVADITDWLTAFRTALAASVVQGANMTITAGLDGRLTFASSGGGGTGTGVYDPEQVRDTVDALIQAVPGSGLTVVPDDAGDVILIGVSAFTIAQISGLQSALNDITASVGALATRVTTLEGTSSVTDLVKTMPGVGTVRLLRDGVDTPTPGATNEWTISQYTGGGTGGSGVDRYQPGLDIQGGIVGCTWADPAGVVIPTSAAAESDGTVLILQPGQRAAARFTVQDVVLDKISWQIGEGSAVNVTGNVAICKADGTVLRKGSPNLTPATVTAGQGNTQTFTLSGAAGTATAPLLDADLNVGDELIVVIQNTMATGNCRLYARGIANLANIDTVSRPTGTLHRSAYVDPAGTLAAVGAVISPAPSATTWSGKKPVPLFIFSRTI